MSVATNVLRSRREQKEAAQQRANEKLDVQSYQTLASRQIIPAVFFTETRADIRSLTLRQLAITHVVYIIDKHNLHRRSLKSLIPVDQLPDYISSSQCLGIHYTGVTPHLAEFHSEGVLDWIEEGMSNSGRVLIYCEKPPEAVADLIICLLKRRLMRADCYDGSQSLTLLQRIRKTMKRDYKKKSAVPSSEKCSYKFSGRKVYPFAMEHNAVPIPQPAFTPRPPPKEAQRDIKEKEKSDPPPLPPRNCSAEASGSGSRMSTLKKQNPEDDAPPPYSLPKRTPP